jgi:hypothetical protein
MYIFFMKVYLVIIIMKLNIKKIDITINKIYREFILVNVYKVKATIIICFSNCNNIF